MTPRPGSALLTIGETAAELRVSPDTVYRLISAGDLAAVDVAPSGSRRPKTRVERSDLAVYIKSRTRRVSA
jgi:excisionase family DNA binding protein